MLRISPREGEKIELVLRIKIPSWLEKIAVLPVLLYRRLRFGYAFRRIPLTQGKYAIVDPDDYWRLCRKKWHARKIANGFYAVHSYREKGGKVKHVLMHRVVLAVGEGKFTDHINRNGLDNRKANLRAATRSENAMNRGKYRRGTYRSRYKGLSWHPGQRKWLAYIKANGIKIFLGQFESEVEAAKAYDRAARKYHGEFAALNFPNASLRLGSSKKKTLKNLLSAIEYPVSRSATKTP